jgi:hypothetical protein
MKSVIFFLMVVGMFMVMHGIYEQKYKALQSNRRVEYKFLPRTYYEEQIGDTDVAGKFKTMFSKESPWFERNVSLPKPGKQDDFIVIR